MAAVTTNCALRASAIIAVPPIPDGVALVAFNVGPRGDIYFVSALNKLDCTTQNAGLATFPKPNPKSPQQYRVQSSRNGQVELDIVVSNERFNIHQSVTGTFRLVDENEEPLRIERIVGRGSKLYALSGASVHVIDANDVIALEREPR